MFPPIGTKHFGLVSQFCATRKPPMFDVSAPDQEEAKSKEATRRG